MLCNTGEFQVRSSGQVYSAAMRLNKKRRIKILGFGTRLKSIVNEKIKLMKDFIINYLTSNS